ncbi:MAG: hypothetical protein V4751_00880 [Pseudomonadota bacterium]
MSLDKHLNSFGVVPFSHGSLLPMLAEYRRPNDKIADLLARQDIIQLRRGLYVLGPERRRGPVSLPLFANLLRGPSCVSLDFALSWHGLIPEGVVEVSSITPGRSATVNTPLGRFSYTHVPLPFYRIGIARMQNPDGTAFLMACPEKAVCDKVALTRNLQIFSVTAMRAFLVEDLRLDEQSLQAMNLSVFHECALAGYKQRSLTLLRETMEGLQCR